MKICSHCRKDLPVLMYSINRGNKDGFNIYCRDCNKLRPFPIPKRKVCEICKKDKAIKHFMNEDTGKASKYCHDCLPRYDLMRYYRNSRELPEEFKMYHREYKRKYRKGLKDISIIRPKESEGAIEGEKNNKKSN